MLKKITTFFTTSSFLVLAFVLSYASPALSQSTQADAIGIRVVPNPNHYSISRWYESQGYSGSPQFLTVDGYEAIRDGRTVYINAAHIIPGSKTIYTNIYLISYNQNQDSKTIDILGQIISHWKFNDNLPSQASTCSISLLKCEDDSQCASNQYCSNSNYTCQLKEEKACEVDNDCPANFFCESPKAKVIRDINRIGKVEELKEALAKYKEANSKYPLLPAGTYLPQASTSLWPSWQEGLLATLPAISNFTDPINRLGYCPGYDMQTCWNKDTKSFVYPKQNLALKLPADSYAMVYTTNDAGSQYNICAVMESKDNTNPDLGYSFYPNNPSGSTCVTATGIYASGDSSNLPPQITELALKGISGLEYTGFIKAIDPEDDPLTWNINTSGSWTAWSSPPTLQGTNTLDKKKLYAQFAGSPGTYPVTITVTDSKGASFATTTDITISSSSVLAQTPEYTYRLDPQNIFNYTYTLSSESSLPSSSLQLVSGQDILNLPYISRVDTSGGINSLKVNFSGIISTDLSFKEDSQTIYTLSLQDQNQSSENNFVINIKVEKPILDFNCNSQVRVGHDYSCYLGSFQQGHHGVTYSTDSSLPTGLSISADDPESQDRKYYLSGTPQNTETGSEIIIKAENEYKTENSKSFMLRVNNYCGDGIKQSPNMEGRGGIFNDGMEACDGIASTTALASESSKDVQYACATGEGADTPYPITTNDQCVFKSPLDGGGYCGDLYCQTKYEDTDTCAKDCALGDIDNDAVVLEGGTTEISCTYTGDCPYGYSCDEGICKGDCFEVTETVRSVTFNEGDATVTNRDYETWNPSQKYNFDLPPMATSNEIDNQKICFGPDYNDSKSPYFTSGGCNVIKLNSPSCDSGFEVEDCPNGYQSRLAVTVNEDENMVGTCRVGFFNKRTRKYIYTCSGAEKVMRCVGDACRINPNSTDIDGVMGADGVCAEYVEPPTPPTPPTPPDDNNGDIGDSTISDTVSFSCPSGETCYHVSSSTGNDSNDGSINSPWKTISKVNSMSDSFKAGDYILFKTGDSFVGQIDVKKSGLSSDPIIYGAYGDGERPKIYGSTVITGWTKHSGNIYKAKVDQDVVRLFLDDESAKLSRYPNEGYFNIDNTNTKSYIQSNGLNTGYDYSGAILIARTTPWSFETEKVNSSSGNSLSVTSPHSSYAYNKGEGFFLMNKLIFIDQENEWYYDKNSKTVYFWAPNGVNPNSHIVRGSVINYGISGPGSHAYIIIENLDIRQQADTSINFYDVDYLKVNNNIIHSPAMKGINIDSKNSNNATISNNLVDGAVEYGIRAFGSSHNVMGNIVQNIALSGYVGTKGYGHMNAQRGINVEWGSYNKIRYNVVRNLNYLGIVMYFAPNTTIEYNYVKNSNLIKDDGAGIYAWNDDVDGAGCAGSVIRYNIIDYVPGSVEGKSGDHGEGCGIYMDERIRGVTIEHNTIVHTSQSGIKLHHNKDTIVRNNTIFNTRYGLNPLSYGVGTSFSNNTVYSLAKDMEGHGTAMFVFQNRVSAQPVFSQNKYINHYYSGDVFKETYWDSSLNNGKGGYVYGQYTWSEWRQRTGQDKNSSLDVSPLASGETEDIFYNASRATKTYSLGGKEFRDVNGNKVSGTFSLEPFTSIILIGKASDFSSISENN